MMHVRSITLRLSLLAAFAVGGLACDAEEPTTAVWIAGAASPSIDPETRLGCSIDGIVDHQGVTIRHQLPVDVETDQSLSITVTTPCDAVTMSARHDTDGRAETTVVAPAGAACMLSVTVEIANDHQVCTSGGGEKECLGLDEICASAEAQPGA